MPKVLKLKSTEKIGQNWEQSIQSFVSDKKIINRAQTTVDWYEENICFFADFAKSIGVKNPACVQYNTYLYFSKNIFSF